MTYGITPAGFVLPTLTELQDEIKQDLYDEIAADLDLNPTEPLGQVVGIMAQREAILWEAIQTLYNAINPGAAEGNLLDNVCALTGTERLEARPSYVPCTVNLDASTTLPAGSTAYVAGQPGNVWKLLGPPGSVPGQTPQDVTSTTSGNYPCVFESVADGPIAANSGTLTQIAGPVLGWNSVTNTTDANLGYLTEKDPDLRIRREEELSAAGGSSLPALRADLLRVPGVLRAFVFSNDTDATDAEGVPPHRFETVIYDGASPAALDSDVALAIWNDKPNGVGSYGSIATVIVDSEAVNRTINWSRATPKPVYLEFTVTTGTGFPSDGIAQIKAAVAADASQRFSLGDTIYSLDLKLSAKTVAGVVNVPTLKLGFSASPVGTADLTVDAREIGTFDTTRILVNGV